jgi:hypothetical protein
VLSLAAAACAAPSGEQAVVPEEPDLPAADVAESSQSLESLEFSLPDISTRHITRDDLVGMLPGGDGEAMPRTNEDLVMRATLDREDESSDIVLYGRTTGVAMAYAGAPQRFVWIDVLPDPYLAHDYLVDAAGDIAKGVGGTHSPDAGATNPVEFAVDVGSDAIGIITDLTDGTGTETIVIARAGRLVFFASEVNPDPTADARVAVQYLAEETLAGIVGALTETDIVAVDATAPRYRFESVVTVADETGRTTITSRGIVDGPDIACTITTTGPSIADSDELVVVDGITWWKTGEDRFRQVSSANLELAGLMLRCPAWPIDIDQAGLVALVESQVDPARHHVNGVDASGYQSDGTGLASVLGSPALISTVNAFSFWVADDAPWLVELALSITGPAAEVQALVGPGITGSNSATVTIRHRVFEIGLVEDSVVSPG